MRKLVFLIGITLVVAACGRTQTSAEEEVPAPHESETTTPPTDSATASAVSSLEMKVIESSSPGVAPIQFVVDITFVDQNRKEGVNYRVLDPQSRRLHQVLWESSAKEVAIVNEKGLLTPTSAGETLVKASIGEKSAIAYLLIQNKEEVAPGVAAEEKDFDIDIELNVDPVEYEEDPPADSEETLCDPLTINQDPFADRVVSYNKGEGGGYNKDLLPDIVLGPPQAHPEAPLNGSFDVVSLGKEGVIVLEFTDYLPCDGEGDDFIVFENPWQYNPDAKYGTYSEPGMVSVSEDGVNFVDFPCDLTVRSYRGCAGVRAVLANPDLNDIDPTDPEKAGGDPFDLKDVGLSYARFVRIRDGDKTFGPAANGMRGFDLDAIAVVNGKTSQ
ncbi:MAG: Ig-like domain-containing protein [Deltaproteobacteria bacterium]|nr:Ig-like domain-containing protein [Deltaproteobacteria bacterium]